MTDITQPIRGVFSTLNLSYLDEPDAFKVNEVVRDWPKTTNPFTLRMAQGLQVGSPTIRVSITTFMDLAGALTSQYPARTFTFSVLIEPIADSEPNLTVVLIDKADRKEPPIMADNAGFFVYAMKWFSSRTMTGAPLTLSVAANALFWVH